jgi:DNA-directed RNA polymerase specialized sigma24 family protein
MTNEQLQAEIKALLPSVRKLAYLCEKKMKQPSLYSIDDLVSEAAYTIIGQIKDGRPQTGKGASIRTYLLNAIRCHYIDLVKKSYKMDYNPIRARTKPADRLQRDLLIIHKYPDSAGSDVVLTLLEVLSHREQEYVMMIIFPPKDIMHKIQRDSKKIRGHIRDSLQMDKEEEKSIRRKIKGILVEMV